MPDIRHRVGIAATRHRVYEMLATKDGLAEFWTTHVEGDSEVGGKLSFFFGRPQPGAVMEVLELSPDDRVQWRCVEGAREWVGHGMPREAKFSLHCIAHTAWSCNASAQTPFCP